MGALVFVTAAFSMTSMNMKAYCIAHDTVQVVEKHFLLFPVWSCNQDKLAPALKSANRFVFSFTTNVAFIDISHAQSSWHIGARVSSVNCNLTLSLFEEA